MVKVLISDKLSPKAKEIFENNNIEVDVKVGMTPEELAACIGEYDGLAIRSATKVTKEILAKAKNLKVVGRAGIGVDNVDIPEATSKGVIVMNTPFGNSVTTAEHAIAMMFAAARKIPQANESTHQGKWEKSKFMGSEIAFKTLGLIGCGNIGSIVANRALGLKMNVKVFDPYLSADRAQTLGVEKAETLDDLFKVADFISLHTPLTEQTKNILGKENLAKVKKGAFIINCARGGLIDEAELNERINAGDIAGAALDVFAEEPAKDNVLFGNENVICTPHLGASTQEAQENVALQVAQQISDYLNKGSITNALNVASVSSEDAAKLKPYLELGESLGGLAGQIVEGGIQKIQTIYEGSSAALNVKPISSLILKGILQSFAEGVNMVNAPVIAQERDIEVEQSKRENDCNYHTLVTVKIVTDKGETSVKGTLFNKQPRIVEVNSIKLEASLDGNMLYIENEDKPGLIGNLGNLLAKNSINIANFHLGRNSANSGNAIALVAVDSDVSESLLKDINKMDSVIKAKLLGF
jgi:D-3-phosphoglycerate dehydrogenase